MRGSPYSHTGSCTNDPFSHDGNFYNIYINGKLLMNCPSCYTKNWCQHCGLHTTRHMWSKCTFCEMLKCGGEFVDSKGRNIQCQQRDEPSLAAGGAGGAGGEVQEDLDVDDALPKVNTITGRRDLIAKLSKTMMMVAACKKIPLDMVEKLMQYSLILLRFTEEALNHDEHIFRSSAMLPRGGLLGQLTKCCLISEFRTLRYKVLDALPQRVVQDAWALPTALDMLTVACRSNAAWRRGGEWWLVELGCGKAALPSHALLAAQEMMGDVSPPTRAIAVDNDAETGRGSLPVLKKAVDAAAGTVRTASTALAALCETGVDAPEATTTASATAATAATAAAAEAVVAEMNAFKLPEMSAHPHTVLEFVKEDAEEAVPRLVTEAAIAGASLAFIVSFPRHKVAAALCAAPAAAVGNIVDTIVYIGEGSDGCTDYETVDASATTLGLKQQQSTNPIATGVGIDEDERLHAFLTAWHRPWKASC